MRVVQFVHRYPPAVGGAEAWTERLGKYLVRKGHSVAVWTTTAIDLSAFTQNGHRETAPGTESADGMTVRRYRPEFRFPGRKLFLKLASYWPNDNLRAMTQPWAPTSLAMLHDAGESPEVDVVHAVAFPYAAILRSALRMAQVARVPFVVTPFIHLGDPNDPKDWIRRAYLAPHLVAILRQADRVLVQTPTEARAVAELGIDSGRIALQGLGVEVSECTGGKRDATRQAWGVHAGEVVVGHLANLSMEKGTPDVLAAVEMARQAGTPVRAVLAGPEMPNFSQFWKWSGPDDWITRLGPLTDQQRRDFYSGIDIFALPSRSDSFGLVFLEAWANGVPVIAYRAGGVVDVIRHEEDGLLVPCGDMDGLTRAIQRMAGNAHDRVAWGRAGRDRLGRDFRWDDKLRIACEAITEWPQKDTKRHKK